MTPVKRLFQHTAALAALGLCLASPAVAEETTGAISVLIENDAFTGSDDAYSSGVGLIWTSREVGSLSPNNPARAWARVWSVSEALKASASVVSPR